MLFFILLCLTVFVLSFLVMVAAQVIRMEKSITQAVELSEKKVKKLYGME